MFTMFGLSIVGIVFLVVVLPIWIIAHYATRWRTTTSARPSPLSLCASADLQIVHCVREMRPKLAKGCLGAIFLRPCPLHQGRRRKPVRRAGVEAPGNGFQLLCTK